MGVDIRGHGGAVWVQPACCELGLRPCEFDVADLRSSDLTVADLGPYDLVVAGLGPS